MTIQRISSTFVILTSKCSVTSDAFLFIEMQKSLEHLHGVGVQAAHTDNGQTGRLGTKNVRDDDTGKKLKLCTNTHQISAAGQQWW